MLDTIGLRMYGFNDIKGGALTTIQAENGITPFAVPEHNELYRKMLKSKNKNFSMTVFFNAQKESLEYAKEEDFLLYENVKHLNHHYQIRDKIRFIEEGTAKEMNQAINGKYRVPSSFSDVTFRINENGGFIDFTVSIPKYLYGHSLAQFIPQQDSDLKFDHGIKFNEFGFQVKHIYPRLRKFIEKFFSDLCNHFQVEALPNEKYIEVRRLDLCYNRYFKDKETALMVLDQLKKLDKKKQIQRNEKLATHDTTIDFHASNGAYHKIYHKGTEYSQSKHGDLKKHLEINREFIEKMINRHAKAKNKQFYGDHHDEIWGFFKAKGQGKNFLINEKDEQRVKAVIDDINNKVPYKVNFLKREMDKILRYEISLTGKFFGNLYKRNVFRRNDPEHKSAMKSYKRIHSIMVNPSVNQLQKITRQERKNYKMMKTFLNRGVTLILGDNQSLIRHGMKSGRDYDHLTDTYKISRFEYAHTVIGKHDAVHFSDYFLKQCCKKLRTFINDYTIDLIEPFDDVISKMHAYNDDVEKRKALYNEHNHYRIKKPNGEYKRRMVKMLVENRKTGEFVEKKVEQGAIYTKASQLLSQSELRKQGLKQINVTLLGNLIRRMYAENMSLDDLFNELDTNKSTKSRLRADLRKFDIYDNSLQLPEAVIMKTDFSDYYWKTSSLQYASKFYRNIKLKAEDYGKNPFDPQEQTNIA